MGGSAGAGSARGVLDSLTRRQAPRAALTHALLPPPGTCRKGWNRLCVPAACFRPPAPPTRAARDPAAPLPRSEAPWLPSAPPGSAARGGPAVRIGRVAPTETPGGGGTEVSERPRRMRWGASSGRRPRSRVGTCTRWGEARDPSKCAPAPSPCTRVGWWPRRVEGRGRPRPAPRDSYCDRVVRCA